RQTRIDAMGKASTYAYDKLGQLLHIGRGAAAVYSADGATMAVHKGVRAITVSFSYDQAGRRLRQTNGNGEATRSVYDLAGNVLETILPSGHGTRNAYDAQRRKTSETDANGNISTWSYDYFGQLQSHTDLGGASYRYEYDHARQLVGQSNTRGQDLRYVYDAVGQLVQARDNALNQQTSIAYDAGGRRIREKTAQNGVVYQDNHLGYDAAGRLRTVDDGRVGISLDYDKAGNRTRIRTHTIDLAGASQDADRWFAYDAMNRQILIDGAVNGNAADDANLVAGQGHRVVYDANGNRISDMSWGRRIVQSGGETTTWLAGYDTGAVDESGKPILVAAQPPGFDESGNPVPGMRDEAGRLIMLPPVYRTTTTPVAYDASMGLSTEVYGYDALDRLSGITRDGVVVDNRFYDGADRVVQSGPLAGLAQAYTILLNGNIIGNGSEIRTNRFDADGRLLHQRVTKSDGEAKYDIDYGTYDAAGNLRTYTMQTHGEKGFTGSYDYSHSRFEGYREGAITGSRSDNPGVAGVTVNSYDVNGNLIAISDSTDPAANRRFINDSAGRALYSDQDGHVQRQLVVDGEVLGRYGDIADQIGSGSGKPVFISQADFNFGYRPVSANYPGAGAGSYQAAAGDTLQSIAQGAYGDSRLWHLIAEANGLSGSRDLRVGQTLTVPNRVGTIHNDASSFRPYDQSRIAGDTTPNLPAPQHGDHGCGGFGQILVVIVAIVVTVYTAGAMAGPAGATLGGTMTAGASVLAGGAVEIGSLAGGLGLGAAGTAAVAGAAGSMASQGVGVALGTQDGFDWKGVALSALGASVSAGVGSYFNRLAAADVPGLERAGAFASRAALGNAVTQGIGVAAGLQDRFSWRNVASAAAGMAVGDAVSGATGEGMHGGSEGFGDTLAQSGMSSTVAGVVAAVMRGGRIDMTRIAADAFGSALADSLVAQGSAMAGRQDRALGAAAGYTEEAYWNSTGKTVADRYAEVYGGQAADIGDRPGFRLAAQDDEVVELTLPPVNVATPRMTAAEEAAFDAQNGTGSLRAMGPVDGFLAFNSFGRGLGGLGAGTARQVAGVAEGGMQAVLAVGDMVSFGMSHLDNMLGGNLRYAPHSGLGAATQMHGVGTTALNVLNGVITGTVQALMQPLSAAYRHDAYLFGESIPGALLAGAQFSRLANLSAAGIARARPDSLRALPGDAGHFGAKSVTPGGTGTALSGHGGKFLDDGYFVVPAGTSITLPRPDISILDRTGLIIEKGDWEGLARLAKRDPRVAKDIDGMTTWLPGAKVPAYTLFEPDAGINLLSNSHSVYRPTPLQKILEPGLGYIQWAACTNFLSYTKY
ncbi:MAG: rane protein of unknown function, partial [Herminiimonas sp.]|nr:rane protein of unknown function [Herminiimonas sp.]